MQYRDHSLYLEDTPLADIARREGTPCYVYSRAAILDRFQAYNQAFGDVPHQEVHHSMAPPSNVGDGIRLGLSAGGRLDDVNQEAAFWTPVSVMTEADGHVRKFAHLITDRQSHEAGLRHGIIYAASKGMLTDRVMAKVFRDRRSRAR